MGGVRRMAVPLSIVATLAIAVMLFHLKQRVGGLEKELAQVNRTIGTHQETIQVLRSEWSFLNRPANIADLAKKLLNMQRTPPDRVIRLEDLPVRAPSNSVTQTAGASSILPKSSALTVRTGGLTRQTGSLQ